MLGLIVWGVSLFFANRDALLSTPGGLLSAGPIVLIIIASFFSIALHEFAHAVTCRHYGGEVREMGFLLLFFMPCFYADLSDAWLFPKKARRMAVTWAGPVMQFFTFAVAVLVWRVTVPGTFPNTFAHLIVLVAGLGVLFNFNPLIKLDGYYLLSDWVEIANLRRKSFDYLGNWLKRVVLGWPIAAIEADRRHRRIFLSYAILATLYSVFLLGYLLFLVGKFLLAKFGGGGLLVMTVVLAVLMRSGITAVSHGTVQHLKYMKTSLRNPVRLVIYLLVVVSITIGLFFVPFPQRVSGEITVRPIAEFNLLLNQFGLLERTLHKRGEEAETKTGYVQMASTDMASLDLLPLVSDGRQVMTGDTLAMILSNQVTSELIANVALLQKYERQLELLRSPPKPEEVAEAQADVNAAEANLDQLQRDYDRAKELREKNLSSNEAYESAQSALVIARAELSKLRSRLELLKSPPKPEQEAVIQAEIEQQRARVEFLRTQEEAQMITAPIDGTIQVPHGNARILSVVDNSAVEVLVPVSDFDIALVALDQPVLVKVRSFPKDLFEGRVVHIPSGAVDTLGQARYFVSVVVPNASYQLENGMTGYAKIEIGRKSLFTLIARRIASFIRVEFWSWW